MPRKKFLEKLVSLDEAIEEAASSFKAELEVIESDVEDALDAILAEDIVSRENLPPMPRSEVDGYAVRSRDLIGASPNNPIKLKLSESPMEGACMSIDTGQYLPSTFDSVCMEEYTQREDGYVKFYRSVKPLENVTPIGADVRKGETILRKDKPLTEFDIAALAMLNIKSVKIHRKPFIGILNTGSELVQLGEKKGELEKINSNEIMLSLLLKRSGLTPLKLGISKDQLDEIESRIKLGLRLCDALIVTGGTAVSESDLAIDAVKSLGGDVVVRGISIRPGRPTSFGVIDNKPVFMLSGNPVACAIGYLFFTLPVIERRFKIRGITLPTIRAKLNRRVNGYPGYKVFARVRIIKSGDEYFAEPISTHGSGMISTLTGSEGFLVIPERLEGHERGEEVEVKLFRVIE